MIGEFMTMTTSRAVASDANREHGQVTHDIENLLSTRDVDLQGIDLLGVEQVYDANGKLKHITIPTKFARKLLARYEGSILEFSTKKTLALDVIEQMADAVLIRDFQVTRDGAKICVLDAYDADSCMAYFVRPIDYKKGESDKHCQDYVKTIMQCMIKIIKV